jgi:hypothetical protein
MNFNELVLEELDEEYKVLRISTKKELKNLIRDLDMDEEDIEQAWIVYMNDGYDEGQVIVAYQPMWKMYSIYTLDPNTIECISHEDINSSLAKAIKNWEFKKNLTPKTQQTFGDIIDEL